MTRINLGINPQRLTDEHLLAEHREIKRLPSCFVKSKASGSIDNIPNKFLLGRGHVLFFVDKPRLTLTRYRMLLHECRERGFNVQDYSSNWDVYSDEDKQGHSYLPTDEDKMQIIHRITEKILTGKKSFYHYKGRPITKDEAINLLND